MNTTTTLVSPDCCQIKEENKSIICRVCLQCRKNDSVKVMSVFEEVNSCLISKMLTSIASVEITPGDGFPDIICSTCLTELKNAYSFKQKCENSHTILQTQLKLGKPDKDKFGETNIKEEIEDHAYLESHWASESIFINESEPIEESTINTACTTDVFKSKPLKFQCNECGGFFKSKCKLSVHWRKEHMLSQLICPICKKTFKTYKSLHSHSNRNLKSCKYAVEVNIKGVGKSRMFFCRNCEYHTFRMKDMIAHLVTHSGERPFTCNICKKTFTQPSSLQAHKENAHKEYVKEGTCPHCGKFIEGRTRMYRHMKSHEHKQIPCKICSTVLSTKSSWLVHMQRHSGVKSFTCEICANSYYTSADLSNHKRRVHFIGRVECYSCDKCEYKAANKDCIQRHRLRHSNNNVACTICGKFLDNDLQLETHKKRHTEKNLECSYCEKKFSVRKVLTAHMRRVHNVYQLNNKAKSVVTVEIQTNIVKEEKDIQL